MVTATFDLSTPQLSLLAAPVCGPSTLAICTHGNSMDNWICTLSLIQQYDDGHAQAHIRMHAQTHTHARTDTHARTHTHTYTHAHTHTRAHTHTHTHTLTVDT